MPSAHRLLSLLPLLGACGQDPILERAEQEAASEVPAGAPSASPTGSPRPPSGEPAPAPPTPQPGPAATGLDPSLAPGGAPAPGGEPPAGTAPAGDPVGPSVLLSGRVVYGGYTGGTLRVDVFDGDQTDLTKRPRVVAMQQVSRPGPFQVSVPQDSGKVWISAFNDANQNNRPDPQDPTGFCDCNPVVVGREAVTDIQITLQSRPPPGEGQGEP